MHHHVTVGVDCPQPGSHTLHPITRRFRLDHSHPGKTLSDKGFPGKRGERPSRGNHDDTYLAERPNHPHQCRQSRDRGEYGVAALGVPNR